MKETNSTASRMWLRYLIYGLVWLLYLVGYNALCCYVINSNLFSETMDTHVSYFRLGLYILGVFVTGIILGMEHLINEKKKEGKFSFNIPRIIFLGIPSLLLGSYVLSAIIGIVKWPFYVKTDSFLFMNFALFGYVLSSNFSKRAKQSSKASRNWLKYAIYGIIIFACLITLSVLYAKNIGTIACFQTELLVYFIFGILLGIEHLLNEKKREGKFFFDIPRTIILGIPGLIFSIYLYFDYGVMSIGGNRYNYFIIPKTMISSTLISDIIILLSGYFIVSSFSKKQLKYSLHTKD